MAKSGKEHRQARNLLLPMKEVASTFEERVKFGHFTKARCHFTQDNSYFKLLYK